MINDAKVITLKFCLWKEIRILTVQCFLFPWGILVFCQINKTNETGHHQKTKLTENKIIWDECSTGGQKVILDHRPSRVRFLFLLDFFGIFEICWDFLIVLNCLKIFEIFKVFLISVYFAFLSFYHSIFCHFDFLSFCLFVFVSFCLALVNL